jgi:hypothetical protein
MAFSEENYETGSSSFNMLANISKWIAIATNGRTGENRNQGRRTEVWIAVDDARIWITIARIGQGQYSKGETDEVRPDSLLEFPECRLSSQSGVQHDKPRN